MLLVAIRSTKRHPGTNLETGKRLKLSFKIPKKLTHTLVPFALRKNITKDENRRNIPRQISRHICYFIETESGFFNGTVLSIKSCPSTSPAGGPEICFFASLNAFAISRKFLKK